MTKCIDPVTGAKEAPTPQPLALPPPGEVPDAQVTQPEPAKKSRAARALTFVQREFRLVYSADETAYAVDDSTPNPQAWRVISPGFASAIRRLAYRKDPSLILTHEDVKEVTGQLQALAELTGQPSPVWLRVAETPRGIEIDIGDESHARIAVEPGHVEVLTHGSTTLFQRSPNFLPFVVPAKHGDINKLLPYLNLTVRDCWLLIAWITYTLAHPKTASTNYVILVLRGDRGRGKSVMCNIILALLLGPSVIGLQAFPASTIDLAIAIQNSHVAFYDNLRKLSAFQADSLCRSATSASISTRMLHTNGGEYTHKLHGAVVLNGIHSFIDQDDLAQRCISFILQRLGALDRTTEKQLRDNYNRDLPVIFKGVLDLIAAIFAHLPTAKAKHPERMLEFVLWLAAMEKALGLPEGQLQLAYSDNLVGAMQDSLQDNPLAEVVTQFARSHTQQPWSGTPTDLLTQLNAVAGPEFIATGNWPGSAISLSMRLKTLQSKLSGAGVDVVIGKRLRSRRITVQYTGTSS